MEPKVPNISEVQEEMERVGLMSASLYKTLVRDGVPPALAGPMATQIVFKLIEVGVQQRAQSRARAEAAAPTTADILKILLGGRSG